MTLHFFKETLRVGIVSPTIDEVFKLSDYGLRLVDFRVESPNFTHESVVLEGGRSVVVNTTLGVRYAYADVRAIGRDVTSLALQTGALWGLLDGTKEFYIMDESRWGIAYKVRVDGNFVGSRNFLHNDFTIRFIILDGFGISLAGVAAIAAAIKDDEEPTESQIRYISSALNIDRSKEYEYLTTITADSQANASRTIVFENIGDTDFYPEVKLTFDDTTWYEPIATRQDIIIENLTNGSKVTFHFKDYRTSYTSRVITLLKDRATIQGSLGQIFNVTGYTDFNSMYLSKGTNNIRVTGFTGRVYIDGRYVYY